LNRKVKPKESQRDQNDKEAEKLQKMKRHGNKLSYSLFSQSIINESKILIFSKYEV
jgi:hypothetical protein